MRGAGIALIKTEIGLNPTGIQPCKTNRRRVATMRAPLRTGTPPTITGEVTAATGAGNHTTNSEPLAITLR
ncbi:MAG TPA: hypothetical protein DIS90_12320 [Cytophagales bacterium]|nr:hypothetical protein [Cytophagales bacterium]